MPPVHVNLIQVAESLGVEESAVENWIRTEGLPCVNDSGRLIFDRAQVASWAAERGFAGRAGFLASESDAGADLNLEVLLRRGGIWRDVAPGDILSILAKVIQGLPGATPQIQSMLAQRIQLPGAINWAPVGGGLALPHMKSRIALGKGSGLIALLMLNGPLKLQDPPDAGCKLDRLLFFVAPSPRAHLELLAGLSSALTAGGLRKYLDPAVPDSVVLSAFAQVSANNSQPKGGRG